MKFSEIPYTRPEGEEIKTNIKNLTEQLQNAGSYEEARSVFLAYDQEFRRTEEKAYSLCKKQHRQDDNVCTDRCGN